MGLFGFSKKRESLPWTQVESVEQLEQLVNEENGKPKVFFKHSTRCPISAMVLHSFETNWSGEKEVLYFIDLLRFRDVSNALASLTGVQHESPQVIIVHNGQAVYNASHNEINPDRIQTRLKKL